jgi:hypothetical protein
MSQPADALSHLRFSGRYSGTGWLCSRVNELSVTQKWILPCRSCHGRNCDTDETAQAEADQTDGYEK